MARTITIARSLRWVKYSEPAPAACASREVGPTDARGRGNLALGNLAREREQLGGELIVPSGKERGRGPGPRKQTPRQLNESPAISGLPTLAGGLASPEGI